MPLAPTAALLTAAWLLFAPAARAEDAVIETGAIEPTTLAGGEGWVVWASHRPDGLLRLRGLRTGRAPQGLHVPRFSQIRAVDVGRGRDGRPTAVYDACRAFCHLYTLDLARGVERRRPLPAAPRGCRTERPVIDGLIFLLRSGQRSDRVPRRCRAGIHELRGDRLIRRQPGAHINRYDISGGRLAFERVTPGQIVQVLARRLAGRRIRLVARSEAFLYDGADIHTPVWQRGRLWLGVYSSYAPDEGASVRRITLRHQIVCEQDQHRLAGVSTSPDQPVPSAWAFAASAIFYTINSATGVELRQRTDPPPRFIACP
jgi:hypothetical protein